MGSSRLKDKSKTKKLFTAFEPVGWFFLVIIFLLTRLINSNSLPLFSDEAYVISKADDIWITGDLLGMLKYTTQPVLIWLVALFIKLPLGVVFAGRLVSAILGLTTAITLGWLASKYIHPQAKWLAFLLVMLLPFSFFYDRTLMFESSLGAFMTLSIGLPIVGLPLAILTKQIGWLVLPISLFLHRNNKKLVAVSLLFAIIIPFAVWFIALGSWDDVFKINFTQTGAGLGTNVNFKGNLLRAKLWLVSYITWPILILAFTGLIKEFIFSFKKRVLSPVFIIGLWSIFVLIFEAKVAVIFYPRYLYPMIIGIVLTATSASWWLYKFASVFNNLAYRLVLAIAIFILMLYPSIKFDYTLINSARSAPLALEDRFQFFEDWTSGIGSIQIEKEVDSFINNRENMLHVYVEGENSYFVTLKRDDYNYNVRVADWLNDPLDKIPQSVLEEKAEVWFVRNRHPDIPDGWPVTLITKVRKTSTRYVYLYRIDK